MRLLGEITLLLGVYKRRILAVGDCLTDVPTILVFVCKNRVILAEFQHIDGSARWLTSFYYNHTPHAGTLPSTAWSLLTHDAVAALLVLCSRARNILSVAKKLHRSCCHQKLTNKIKPPIL